MNKKLNFVDKIRYDMLYNYKILCTDYNLKNNPRRFVLLDSINWDTNEQYLYFKINDNYYVDNIYKLIYNMILYLDMDTFSCLNDNEKYYFQYNLVQFLNFLNENEYFMFIHENKKDIHNLRKLLISSKNLNKNLLHNLYINDKCQTQFMYYLMNNNYMQIKRYLYNNDFLLYYEKFNHKDMHGYYHLTYAISNSLDIDLFEIILNKTSYDIISSKTHDYSFINYAILAGLVNKCNINYTKNLIEQIKTICKDIVYFKDVEGNDSYDLCNIHKIKNLI
jgi:hypothetical protein